MSWKDPPADPNKLWLNRSIEIQVLLACNWSCSACDQHSNFHGISYIKKGTMTLAQIQHFIDELKTANGYFGRIRLVGGEPTMHPKFAEIVRLLHESLVPAHVGGLELITNGDNNSHKIEPVRHLLRVRISNERDKQRSHVANLPATPASLGYQGKRCGQPEFCGWSLSYFGYSPCSSGAGIMRLRDLMGDHQRLTLPTVRPTEQTWPGLQSLCDQCYHGLKDEDKVRCGTGQQPGQLELNTPSAETWSHLGQWVQGKPAAWPIYGEKVSA